MPFARFRAGPALGRRLVAVVLVAIGLLGGEPADAQAPDAAAVAPAAARAANPKEKRIALVIGNGRYPRSALPNPENDARLIAGHLRRLHFDVDEQLNLDVRNFRRVLRNFARRAQEDGVTSVLYYAGHGMQIDGRNYLLPVDLDLRDAEEVKDDSVDIDELYLSRLDRARASARIVILDACRDNPFATRTRNLRSVGGLAEMAARGALIAYASAPGAAAEDGAPGGNSIYTRHLADEMLKEGLEVEQMFKNVRVKVLRDTQERQVPWVNSSLTVDFSFNPGAHFGSAEDPRGRERIGRLEAELATMRKALDEARNAARPAAPGVEGRPDAVAPDAAELAANAARAARLEVAVRDTHQALQDALARATEATRDRTPIRPAPRPSAATGGPVATGPLAGNPIAAGPLAGRQPGGRPPASPAAAGGRRGTSALCSELLHRASMGDALSAEDESHLIKECR